MVVNKESLKKIALTDDRGSISVLIIALFYILLCLLVVMTDISAVYFAQRSLSSSAEAAIQRGSKNLNKEAYYQGEFNTDKLISNIIGNAELDPGIPIDCNAGLEDIETTLQSWEELGPEVSRVNLYDISLHSFKCDGFSIEIEATGTVKLPFTFSFIGIDEVDVTAHAGGSPLRKSNNNYSGVDIGN